mmetsp:Transcript_17585/g.55544  ORF Transcript_17585/g.55544 Transcript_17585/m.55544 type:complete len:288 (+) Transcript_17585:214-1077(+)
MSAGRSRSFAPCSTSTRRRCRTRSTRPRRRRTWRSARLSSAQPLVEASMCRAWAACPAAWPPHPRKRALGCSSQTRGSWSRRGAGKRGGPTLTGREARCLSTCASTVTSPSPSRTRCSPPTGGGASRGPCRTCAHRRRGTSKTRRATHAWYWTLSSTRTCWRAATLPACRASAGARWSPRPPWSSAPPTTSSFWMYRGSSCSRPNTTGSRSTTRVWRRGAVLWRGNRRVGSRPRPGQTPPWTKGAPGSRCRQVRRRRPRRLLVLPRPRRRSACQSTRWCTAARWRPT